ncbi:MAG: ATP-dependent zinc protease [Phycisphaerales bacterium]|nr:MAG: ATP-dependent zinc protease [Phycisphaerales bacterium]
MSSKHHHATGHDVHHPPKTIVGWREYVSLPEWGLTGIKAKADTGARTSVIDVTEVIELEGNRVRFEVVVNRRNPDEHIWLETDIVRRTRVKSSFGASHDRLIVKTLVKLGEIEKEIELSLVSRKNMLCRMLLGRKALEPDLVVDPGRRYIHGRKRRKKNRQGGAK